MIRDVVANNLVRYMRLNRSCQTQQSLAEKSGIGQSTIGRIIRKEVDTSIDTLASLAKALGIRPGDLLAEEDDGETGRPLSYDELSAAMASHTAHWDDDQFVEFIGLVKAYRNIKKG